MRENNITQTHFTDDISSGCTIELRQPRPLWAVKYQRSAHRSGQPWHRKKKKMKKKGTKTVTINIFFLFYWLALGMESKNISDSQITASSMYGGYMYAHNARLNYKYESGLAKSWAAQDINTYQWLQIDLLRKRLHVCAIATQGYTGMGQWIETYSLQYSDGGVVFIDYKQVHIFQGNTNSYSIVKNDLVPAIVARYIRVLPKSWSQWIAMRMELYGCVVY